MIRQLFRCQTDRYRGYPIRRLLYKVMLIVVGKEVTRACETDQLCSEIEVGIERGIHHMQSLWDRHEKNENDFWGFLLIDARNTFNEGNRKMMIWVARHE